MAKPKLIYWDTCVFLHHWQQTSKYKSVLNAIVRDAELDNLRVVTSAITVVEAVSLESNRQPTEAEVKEIKKRLSLPWVYTRILDPVAADRAVQLRRAFRLSSADAVHAATAQLARCDELHTYDPKILTVKYPIQLKTKFCEPYHHQPDLF